MSEPPVCVVARWPPLAPESDGDRDRPGPNSARRCPSRASLRLEAAPTHSRRQGRGMGVPGHTQTPRTPRCPHPGAASPRAGQRLPGDRPGCLRAAPFPGSGSSPPPPGASSSRSSSPPLPCRACTARDSHRRLRGGRASPCSEPAPQPLPPEPPAAPPQRLPLPPPDFRLLPRMRRPTRRLALSLLGVLWLAALLLFFFGARRKLEAAEPEGHTPEVRKGRRGRGCSGGTWPRCRRPGKKGRSSRRFSGPPSTPSRSPSSLVPDPCLSGGALGRFPYPPVVVHPPLPPLGLGRRQPQPLPRPASPEAAAVGAARPWELPAGPAPCPATNLEHPRLRALGSGGTCAPQGNERRGLCHRWGTGDSCPPWVTLCSRALP